MKARVKATGDIVDVHRLCMSSQGDIWQKKSVREYFAHELDFDVKEPPKPRYNLDYWTRLEHQYAGMAMQAMLANPEVLQTVTSAKELLAKDYAEKVAIVADRYATALVQELKEKEEK